jgi:hypothetical protein
MNPVNNPNPIYSHYLQHDSMFYGNVHNQTPYTVNEYNNPSFATMLQDALTQYKDLTQFFFFLGGGGGGVYPIFYLQAVVIH